jgi:hypothetical protein
MKYYIDLPNVDPEKPWHIIKEFDNKKEAIEFCDCTFNTKQGLYCLLSFDGDYWVVDVPNPNLDSSNNQFIDVGDGYRLKADALDYAQKAYKADSEGNIYLVSEV